MTATSMSSKKPDARELQIFSLGLSVPPIGGGAAIVFAMRKKKKESDSELSLQVSRQLENTFLELLKNDSGQISVIDFAIASKLSIEESKQYLDKKATQLNGNFDVADNGKISYQFNFR